MSINRIGCLQPDGGSRFPPEPCKGKMVANPYLLCIFCDSTSQCNFVSAHFSHPSISTASVSPSAPGTLNLIALNNCAALCSCCLHSGVAVSCSGSGGQAICSSGECGVVMVTVFALRALSSLCRNNCFSIC